MMLSSYTFHGVKSFQSFVHKKRFLVAHSNSKDFRGVCLQFSLMLPLKIHSALILKSLGHPNQKISFTCSSDPRSRQCYFICLSIVFQGLKLLYVRIFQGSISSNKYYFICFSIVYCLQPSRCLQVIFWEKKNLFYCVKKE